MFDILFWGGIGVLIGAIFAETVRAGIRKVTKGRFFGPVPGKDTVDLTQKAP